MATYDLLLRVDVILLCAILLFVLLAGLDASPIMALALGTAFATVARHTDTTIRTIVAFDKAIAPRAAMTEFLSIAAGQFIAKQYLGSGAGPIFYAFGTLFLLSLLCAHVSRDYSQQAYIGLAWMLSGAVSMGVLKALPDALEPWGVACSVAILGEIVTMLALLVAFCLTEAGLLAALFLTEAKASPAGGNGARVGKLSLRSQLTEDVGGSAGKLLANILHLATGSATVPALVGVVLTVVQCGLVLSGTQYTTFFGKFCPMIGDTSVRRAFPAEYHRLTQWNPATKIALAAADQFDAVHDRLTTATLPTAIAIHTATQLGRVHALRLPCDEGWKTAWILAESFAGDVATLLINRLQQQEAAQAAEEARELIASKKPVDKGIFAWSTTRASATTRASVTSTHLHCE